MVQTQTFLITEIKTELIKISQQLPNIYSVNLIGSIIGNDFNNKSDIDLLVDFKEFNLNEFLLIERKLKKLTGRKIQIVIENECNPLFLKLNPNRILIYKCND